MLSKNQVLKIIEQYASSLKTLLQLNHCSIKWHVHHSKDKALKAKGFMYTDCVAVCVWNHKKKRTKTYDIIIFYDLQLSRKDTIGSIFHELMHIRMRQWDGIIKTNPYSKTRRGNLEEQLVQLVEQVFLDSL